MSKRLITKLHVEALDQIRRVEIFVKRLFLFNKLLMLCNRCLTGATCWCRHNTWCVGTAVHGVGTWVERIYSILDAVLSVIRKSKNLTTFTQELMHAQLRSHFLLKPAYVCICSNFTFFPCGLNSQLELTAYMSLKIHKAMKSWWNVLVDLKALYRQSLSKQHSYHSAAFLCLSFQNILIRSLLFTITSMQITALKIK